MPQAPQPVTKGHSIILIGMMGCGKTTVGKELGKATGMPLLDMDAVIEEQRGKSIPEIFRDEGEVHFRALETALLQYLVGTAGTKPPAIISTGGGVVGRAENRALLRQLGLVVWLDVDVHTLLSRTARTSNRPLLKTPNRRQTMERLLAEREPLYAETAHLRLPGARMDVAQITAAVRREAALFFGK